MSVRLRLFSILTASFLLGILIGIIVYAIQNNQLQAEWINVIASLILAVLTGIFVVQNKNTLTEMTMARKAEFLPNISANLGYPGPLAIDLIIKNTGKGPAFDVKVNYGFEPLEEPHKKWIQPLISSEEEFTFFLRPNNFDKLAKKFDFLIVQGTCKDMFGQEHNIDETIDLKEINKGYHDAMMLYQDNLVRKLGSIASEIKKVGEVTSSSQRQVLRDKQNFPLLMRIGNLEIRQPPLQSIYFAIGNIYLHGNSLDGKTNTKLKQLNEGDIIEIYCSNRFGEIRSGVYELTKIELNETVVGQNTIFSFNVDLTDYERAHRK